MRASSLLIGFAIFVGACSAESKSNALAPNCITVGPHVSPPTATLRIGDTLRGAASLPPCQLNGLIPTWRWRSSDTSVAVVDSIAGLVQARALGSATIIATLQQLPSSVGAMALRVVP